ASSRRGAPMANPARHDGTNRRGDVPSPIKVVRELAPARRATHNGSRSGHLTTDDDRRVLRELSDGIREAFVADRIAGIMARQFEADVSRDVREVVRTRLERELRGAFHAATAGVADARRATALLNSRLSDA